MVPSRALKHKDGQSMTELAVILPILLLLLIAILDFGRAVYAYHVVANCAREGARYGMIPTNPSGGIAARARDTAVGLDPAALSVGVSYGDNTVRVDVSYRFRVITPLISNIVGGTVVLHSASTMYTGY